MPDPTTIVCVVDDDAGFRKAICRLLNAEGYSVEPFPSADELLRRGPLNGPGCIVLDLQLPGTNGLAVQAQLAARNIRTPIVFLSGHGDIPSSVTAIKAGAVDFLTKPVPRKELLAAVDDAIKRDRLRRATEATKLDVVIRAGSLTPREMEVMRLVVQGRLNKQIAAELGISEATTKVHRARVMQKMRVVSVADLVRATAEAGLGSLPAPLHEPADPVACPRR